MQLSCSVCVRTYVPSAAIQPVVHLCPPALQLGASHLGASEDTERANFIVRGCVIFDVSSIARYNHGTNKQ